MFHGLTCTRDHRGQLHLVGGSVVRDYRGRLICTPSRSIEHAMGELHLSSAPASAPVSKALAALRARAAAKK